MKPITDERLRTLLVEAHQANATASTLLIERLREGKPEITYPPGARLSEDEVDALRQLDLCPHAASGLRKLVADAGAYAFFQFFCVLDAVGDPEEWPHGTWHGAALAEPTEEDSEMVHDLFYDTWWDYAPDNGDT